MKIAVLSDIHGNFPALQAVASDIAAWHPDQVIVNGDIVNRGPCSLACLNFVLDKQAAEGWQLLRGNHEDYVLACSAPDFVTDGPEFEIYRFGYWTFQQLNGQSAKLAAMPKSTCFNAPDSSQFYVTHASVHHNRDGIYAELSDAEIRSKITQGRAVFVTSHTHQPLIRQLDETLVVNTGAVGSPFDLDWRSSYGRFHWTLNGGWQAEIKRVTYDRQLIEQDYVKSGFLDGGGALAQLTLVELRKARGLLYRWAMRHEAAVLAGSISLEESVRDVLGDDDVRPFLGSPGWMV